RISGPRPIAARMTLRHEAIGMREQPVLVDALIGEPVDGVHIVCHALPPDVELFLCDEEPEPRLRDGTLAEHCTNAENRQWSPCAHHVQNTSKRVRRHLHDLRASW